MAQPKHMEKSTTIRLGDSLADEAVLWAASGRIKAAAVGLVVGPFRLRRDVQLDNQHIILPGIQWVARS